MAHYESWTHHSWSRTVACVIKTKTLGIGCCVSRKYHHNIYFGSSNNFFKPERKNSISGLTWDWDLLRMWRHACKVMKYCHELRMGLIILLINLINKINTQQYELQSCDTSHEAAISPPKLNKDRLQTFKSLLKLFSISESLLNEKECKFLRIAFR